MEPIIHLEHAEFTFPQLTVPQSLRDYCDLKRETAEQQRQAIETALKEIRHALG